MIRHEKVREESTGGGLTMTSYTVDNKTSLSWSLSNFYEKAANINFNNFSVYKC